MSKGKLVYAGCMLLSFALIFGGLHWENHHLQPKVEKQRLEFYKPDMAVITPPTEMPVHDMLHRTDNVDMTLEQYQALVKQSPVPPYIPYMTSVLGDNYVPTFHYFLKRSDGYIAHASYKPSGPDFGYYYGQKWVRIEPTVYEVLPDNNHFGYVTAAFGAVLFVVLLACGVAIRRCLAAPIEPTERGGNQALGASIQ